MQQHFFQCFYCLYEISMLFDPSITSQIHIEDCEVRFEPIEVKLKIEEGDILVFDTKSIDQ